MIIIACLLCGILASARLESWLRQENSVQDLEAYAHRLSAIASILTTAAPSERDEIISLAHQSGWDISLQTTASLSGRFTTASQDERFVGRFFDWLFPQDSEIAPYAGWRTFLDGKRVVAAKIGDTELLVIEWLPETFLRSDALTFGSNYLVVSFMLIVFMSAFAIWMIARPLRQLALAAARANITSGPTLFPEKGGTEIVALARALNGMQSRILKMVAARTRMLRGISHDLRTPLTRLRLRAERVGDDEVREALLADIGSIDRLLKESLSYLRHNGKVEEFEQVDLVSVAKTICDEFADIGKDVSYDGPIRLVLNCSPLAMTRAITNLCENAVKFGTRTKVSLRSTSISAIIEVEDNGPGIAAQHLKKVKEPFYKADGARGGTDGGFGLGLSIVEEIVRAHHGHLELFNRHPTGLIAKITLPFQAIAS